MEIKITDIEIYLFKNSIQIINELPKPYKLIY